MLTQPDSVSRHRVLCVDCAQVGAQLKPTVELSLFRVNPNLYLSIQAESVTNFGAVHQGILTGWLYVSSCTADCSALLTNSRDSSRIDR